MSGSSPTAGHRYLAFVHDLVTRLEGDDWSRIDAAAALIADALAAGRVLHAFGSGHSHLIAEELYYRAGGLVQVRPILFDGLMLHASAPLSTSLERLPGLAAALLADHPMAAGDVLVIASNSGGNAVTTELARLARVGGIHTVAITSLAHASSRTARGRSGPRLHDIADVTIDNGGVAGDAATIIEGLDSRVASTSTVIGAAIVETLVAEVVERLVALGVMPEIYVSSNLEGGDARNAAFGRPGGGR